MGKQGRIEKAFLMGLGAIAFGSDKAHSIVEDLTKSTKLMERGERERSELKKKIEGRMSQAVSVMGFATHADIEDLNYKMGGLDSQTKNS